MGRKRNDESIRILVSGSDNYNNNVKLINIMDKILQNFQNVKIATFQNNFGAELNIMKYCAKHQYPIKTFSISMFKGKRTPKYYYMLLSAAVKWCDLLIIFSNQKTNKINYLLGVADKLNKQKGVYKE